MPFISKDWRSPGEEWVRYEGGWERKKTVSTSSGSQDERISSQLPPSLVHESQPQEDFVGDYEDQSEDPVKSNAGKTPVCWSTSTLPRKHKLSYQHRSGSPRSVLDNIEEDDPRENYSFQLQLQRQIEHRRLRVARAMANDEDADGFDSLDRRESKARKNVWLRLVDESSDKPFCQITLKNTREVAGFNGLADALIRLDFCKAISDIRRFSYVASLMHMLFSHDKLRHLPGAAQKVLFRMLEVVADVVYTENRDEFVLRKLLEQLHTTMTIYHVWGSHLGGSHLFKQHEEIRRKITEFVEKMQTEYKQDLAAPGLTDQLPEECIREVLLRLSNPDDILRAGKTCTTLESITKEKRIWRELVQTHFTKVQIDYVVSQKPHLKDKQDWQEIYKCLRRRFGLREEFTEMIDLCRKCSALFWHSIGHPCLVPASSLSGDSSSSSGEDSEAQNDSDSPASPSNYNSSENFVPVTPTTFLTFFSV